MPSPAPRATRRRRRRRRRWPDEVRGELAIGDAYPLRPSQNAAPRGDEELARARDDHPAARGAVALALDLAQDLAVHPRRGGHRPAAVEEERDARAPSLVEGIRARDLVAHELLAPARVERPAEARDRLAREVDAARGEVLVYVPEDVRALHRHPERGGRRPRDLEVARA